MLIESKRKRIAIFFLGLMIADLCCPSVSYALTSGPAQPEMQQFTPAGTGDLVDLFSGDMRYSIPVLDVGGYPVNLAYRSGTSMEDEASWVGEGWNLNPGAINRTLRGLPDEFDGSKGTDADRVVKEYSRKEFKKVSGQIVLKPSIFAFEFGKASVNLSVYKDNYYGIGASVGASLGFNLAKNSSTPLTAGLGISSDSRDGVSVNPSLSLSYNYDQGNEDAAFGVSGSFNYNTRAGLKNFSLSTSFSSGYFTKLHCDDAVNAMNSSVSFVHEFAQSYTPKINVNTSNSSKTFSIDAGPIIFGGYVGVGGSGSIYKEKISEFQTSTPAYGYLNYHKGNKNEQALLDFNREKDGVFLSGSPSIAVPIATHDYFNVMNQMGCQQFRPYFSGNYVVYDKENHNNTTNAGLGVTVGAGNLVQGGARIDLATAKAQSKKWTSQNNYLAKGEYTATGGVLEEPAYFKQVGEPSRADESFYNKIAYNKTTQVAINDRQNSNIKAVAYEAFKSREDGRTPIAASLRKSNREIRNNVLNYLNAEQAAKYALDKKINTENRVTTIRKKHHISEMQVTDNEGKRMVYGIPVYNVRQDELSFSVGHHSGSTLALEKKTGIYTYEASDPTRNNSKGRDNLYSKESMPPYPTSFLLTGILSPDYVDKTGNGISDDDLGTAVKFNYSKTSSGFKWRAPYDAYGANYNEGLLSDDKDDKASFVYGEKELWYLKSIESKTMIAVFETSNREDGLGVTGFDGGKSTSQRVQKLDRIKLFSKADYFANPATAKPIKTVNFEYDYSLYPQVINNSGVAVDVNGGNPSQTALPNVNAAQGKLTLKKVYFTFGASSRGRSNPYQFDYDFRTISNVANVPLGLTDTYAQGETDRWGTYRPAALNFLNGNTELITNAEYPYSLQDNTSTPYDDKELSDRLASKWQLNKITTPSGSEISIDYESDDYAYVQNRKAMQMCPIVGISNSATGLIDASAVTVSLPKPLSPNSISEFQEKYLRQADGQYLNKIFFRALVDMDNKGHKEYVNGYAEIDLATSTVGNNGSTVSLALKKVGGYNPIARAAWQMLRSDLPFYANDNYDNSDVGDGEAAVRSIIQSIGNLKELFTSLDKRAISRHFGSTMDFTHSMVRLQIPLAPNTRKLGGGARVRKVQISDQWASMAGNGHSTAKYGQVYEYYSLDKNGNRISTGVAAYEPQAGNEENPFHEPVEFTEKVHWTADRHHYIEKPYCESYFPAPEVGYSKVKVTATGDDYVDTNPVSSVTGFTESEFYTARDFPTLVDYLPLDYKDASNSLTLSLFASVSKKNAAASQGFKIELNDMHGKPRSVKVYSKGGDLISSSEYFYSVKDPNAETKELQNAVDVLQKDGTIVPNTLIGTEVDYTTDVRESTNISVGTSIGAYVGTAVFMFPLPFGGINFNATMMSDNFNSISSVKVIRRFGIVKKVITTQNGSSISAENLLWDELTGNVVLTKNQTEFDRNTYSFSYPAHMAYNGMGPAYLNSGISLPLYTWNNGAIDIMMYQYLTPGDELVSLDQNIRGWVISSSDNSYRLIDKDGQFLNVSGYFMIVRSGRRNLLTMEAGSVILERDPREGTAINIAASKKILDAKAIVYKDLWGTAVRRDNNVSSRQYAEMVSGPPPSNPCNELTDFVLNPYYRDVLGVWRPSASYLYTVPRAQKPGKPDQPGGTDIRTSGYYASFNPFWTFGGSGISNSIPPYSTVPSNDDRWVWNARSVHYDEKGNEVESVDPLGRYSSAIYGYQQSVATATAANARRNEIAFDGFEDYGFKLGIDSGFECKSKRQIDFGNFYQIGSEYQGPGGNVVPGVAHTGLYSYRLTNGYTTSIGVAYGNAAPPPTILDYDVAGRYKLVSNELAFGFQPVQNKKYLLSFWVKDNNPALKAVQALTVTINGVTQNLSSPSANVEGWKKVDLTFDSFAGYIYLSSSSSSVYIDDIRVVPLDGQISTYVYHDKNMRLMAQLDENNYATFYEYDEEGTPVRVKKETERGIMTLKENRQAFRQ